MRGKSFKTFVAVLTIATLAVPSLSNAATKAKAGAPCTKKGATQSVNGKKFTCVVKGKKLVWNSGVAIAAPAKPTPTPVTSNPPTSLKVDFTKVFNTDDGYHTLFPYGPCQNEADIPEQWVALQSYLMRSNKCAGPMQIAQYELGSRRPQTTLDPASAFSDTTPCKIPTPRDNRFGNGFTNWDANSERWRSERRYPSPNTVVQLLPFYTDDMVKPTASPASVYGRYLDLMKTWIDYSSDFGSQAEVRIPQEFLRLPGNLSEYAMAHENRPENPINTRFRNALIAAADPLIDFSGVNIVIAVPPQGVSLKSFHQGFIGTMSTAEGNIYVAMSAPAYLAADSDFWGVNLVAPFFWFHELQHAGIGFDDTYGDASLKSDDAGMGQIGLMSPWGGDFLTWQKWILGFMRDAQVRCVTSGSPTTHWIAPSTVKTQLTKAVIVPVSKTKAIAIESLRPGGLFYKIPLRTQGVLVYEIDADMQVHGHGMTLARPVGRTVDSNPFWMADAPLKQGEYTITNGYKITVVESGTFGDVVRVEKV